MAQAIHIKNATVWKWRETAVRDLYLTNVVSESPLPNALTIDLQGYTIFPGLVNAHDHLELNHYPRTKFREVYENARQWSADVNARLDTSPYKELRAYPLEDKLFIGGLKNLLCGATTVAHHNPPHKPMFRKDFPVRVLRNYGWAHSLYLSSEEEIVRSYQRTPKEYPWFIHIAEGTDAEAAGEYQRLKAMGCVKGNTVFVHGVGISPQDEEEVFGHDLILCPTTNQYLLNRVLNTSKDLEHWVWTPTLLLGSDSRLTANGDLLDEMRFAAKYVIDDGMSSWVGICDTSVDCVVSMVTWYAAGTLPIKGIGTLEKDSPADLIAIKDTPVEHSVAERLCNAHRADLALIIKGGVPQIGDPDVMAQFPHIRTIPATLDGKPKAIHIDLARRISQCLLKESGLTLETPVKQSLFGFLRR
jgi:cytosine/adenosine deaminase-related metal-dependent hydrolase